MNWFTKSEEKKKQEQIQWQKDHGIIGYYKRRYAFEHKLRQWIAPGYLTQHNIKGSFDIGLMKTDPKDETQDWSFEIRDLVFDWNNDCIPELYFLFDLPYRMDIRVDKRGQIIANSTWVDYNRDWKEKYKKIIFEKVKDKERADNFYQMVSASSKTMANKLLKINPLVKTLSNVAFINLQKITQPDNSFEKEQTVVDYFAPQIDLTLSTMWFNRRLDNQLEEWSNISRLDEDRFKRSDFKAMLRKITNMYNPSTELTLDCNELYRLSKPDNDTKLLEYANTTTQTLIPETWVKEEWLELVLDEKGVVYG